MNGEQVEHDIRIIREMIDRTRRETADTGPYLMAIGVFSLIMMLVMAFLPKWGMPHLTLPALFIMFFGNGIIGFLIVRRWEKNERVESYAKTIFLNMWLACGIVTPIIIFLFPLTGVYSYRLVPVICMLIMGIGFFVTGTVYELRYFWIFSLMWWGGACLMAYTDGMFRLVIMSVVILAGFILPGYLLNRVYSTRSVSHEA